MTILCITAERLPGIRPCTHRGEHKITCHDHPGYTRNPGTCTGCLPRRADRGYLCARCYDQVEAAYTKWDTFAALLAEVGDRAVSPAADGIRASGASGYANLPLTTLALDECQRLLASFAHRTLEEWVSTEHGARDAVQFAKAANSAYRSLEVEERPHPIERVRCTSCGYLSLVWQPTRFLGDHVTVECSNCGHSLDQERLDRFEDQQRTARTSEACADSEHDSCRSLDCRCDCHQRTISLYTVQTPAHLLKESA